MLESIIEKNVLTSLLTEESSGKETREVRQKLEDMKRGEYVKLDNSG